MESEYKYSGQKFLGLLFRNESPKNYELIRVANFVLILIKLFLVCGDYDVT